MSHLSTRITKGEREWGEAEHVRTFPNNTMTSVDRPSTNGTAFVMSTVACRRNDAVKTMNMSMDWRVPAYTETGKGQGQWQERAREGCGRRIGGGGGDGKLELHAHHG